MKKNKSTTKFIMYLMMFITVVVIGFSLVFTWVTKDTTILTILIPSVFVETATCTGFYFWKRRLENLIQFKLQYGEEFIENTVDDL